MDHDYGAALEFGNCRTFVEAPSVVVKLEDPWHEEEVTTTTTITTNSRTRCGGRIEPHPDENQVISFLDSLLASKKSQEAAEATTTAETHVKNEAAGGLTAHHQDKDGNGDTNGSSSSSLIPQSSSPGSIVAKFVDGEFSRSYEQTDLRINEVVGLELIMDSDPNVKQLYGTVNVYLVHSHELFLRDIIDAKGHQGVKDDTDEMKDFPLRAWVANGNGIGEYNVLQTKMHGDVRGVTVHLQGENKINLLFTVLSTDQRNFGRNHKAKLWSLEVVGELNNIPVKVCLPVQVVACLRNPKKLKRSKRRLDGGHRLQRTKYFKPDTELQIVSDLTTESRESSTAGENSGGVIDEILRLQGEYLERLPQPFLMYELTRARALASAKMVYE